MFFFFFKVELHSVGNREKQSKIRIPSIMIGFFIVNTMVYFGLFSTFSRSGMSLEFLWDPNFYILEDL